MHLAVFLTCLGLLCARALELTVVAVYPATQRFSFLSLRGSALGLSWQRGQQMQQTAPTVWTLTLPFTAASTGTQVELKSLADDTTWQIGANAVVVLPSSSINVTLYPWFFTARGRYDYPIYDLYSPQLKNRRTLVVYTPPSYLENPLKTHRNVLIMHDGQNLFNASTSFGGVAWDCQDTVDALINQGAMEEVVIVGVYNSGQNRINEYTYSYSSQYQAGGQGDLYLDFLEQTVLPYVQKQYRIAPQRERLGILGSSLGGLISCYAGWTRSRLYGLVGCMSSSFWWNTEDFTNVIMTKSPAPPLTDFYVDVGLAEVAQQTQSFAHVRQHMLALGLKLNDTLKTYEAPGADHSEYWWGKRFNVPMAFLYPPRPLSPGNPTPSPSPSPAPAPSCTVQRRVDCGFVGITEQQCVAQGCCWVPVSPNPDNLPWCFYPQS
eukprot:TRINITY_DN406_c0_g1_i1.p1 TRINITY_DN406_c0_g1~~TRINITY_DN406_c0_g1_i1.p1  ORF type:complete len:435 (-),score=67.90 TRINITY_DN406_c0_g1_i1:1243-2547(-)